MKIHILDYENYSAEALGIYKSMGDVEYGNDVHKDTEILVIRFTEIRKHHMDLPCNYKIIGTSTTGLDHIDVEYAESKGIKVISLNDVIEKAAIISSTAEHTMGLIIQSLVLWDDHFHL